MCRYIAVICCIAAVLSVIRASCVEGMILLRILSVIDVIRCSAVAVALVVRVALSVISAVILRAMLQR